MLRILVVEDEGEVARALREGLGAAGCAVALGGVLEFVASDAAGSVESPPS